MKCKRFRYWVVSLAWTNLTASFLWYWSLKIQFFNDIWHPLFQRLWRPAFGTYMKSKGHKSNAHCFWICLWRKSTKLFILLPLRTIYFWTFQCETPCSWLVRKPRYMQQFTKNNLYTIWTSLSSTLAHISVAFMWCTHICTKNLFIYIYASWHLPLTQDWYCSQSVLSSHSASMHRPSSQMVPGYNIDIFS